MERKNQRNQTRRRLWFVSAAIALLSTVLGFSLLRPTPSDLLKQARMALAKQDYEGAITAATAIDRSDPLWPKAGIAAGDAARLAGRPQQAAEFYSAVPRDGSRQAVSAALQLAESAFATRRLSQAESDYRYVLQQDPRNQLANQRMGFLLGVTGRRWEAQEYLMNLVRDDQCSLDQLIFLIDLDRPVDQGLMLGQFAEAAPEDIAVRLGLAAQAVQDRQFDFARQTLPEILARQPDLVAAHALLGELIIDADDSSYESWRENLPPKADQHPTIWFVRGVRARRRGQPEVAARCLQEALRRAPNHRRALYQLGQILVELNLSSGEEFGVRSRQLYELTRSMNDVLESDGKDAGVFRHVVDLLEQSGRPLEARAWALTAARTTGSSEWRDVIARLTAHITADSPAVLLSMNPAFRIDLGDFPSDAPAASSKNATVQSKSAGSIRFQEETDCGPDFEYFNGEDPSTDGVRMFEQNGGGVAALDFDGDGRPDLYFPQGAAWQHSASLCTTDADRIDRLFRNVRGQRFQDVTDVSGIDERQFSQGCSAGDVDNDGFPDLYVANVGRNRLFHNNGDGTYSEFNGSLTPCDWTSSCVIVDLNADGNPDLFDVNFVDGTDVYERICDDVGCNPRLFSGVPDRLLISSGDGTFVHIPAATPTRQPKGLGVLAADLHTRGRPDLFIANDAVPNFLLRNEPAANSPGGIRLEEAGFSTGLAFNRDGLALACMGIAADDADADGRLDFFVTNFRHEPNTLYLQLSPGQFVDATQAAQLDTPALPYVSWGTQFLDANRNGWMDLVVVNGQIADYRVQGGEYHQRPQFFENMGHARFRELQAADAGDYFGRKYLGRGLARLDWNQDGRTDFAVSNMLAPASLVTNTSEHCGHYVNLLLRATSSARDAVGAVVTLDVSDRKWTKQLTAGDGFMASNERVLQFGLGSVSSVGSLHVAWPSGTEQTFETIPVDTTVILTEGRPAFCSRE